MIDKKASIVIVTDTNFVIAVYLLICSLRKNGVKTKIYVLGIKLNHAETALLDQFDNCRVYPANPSIEHHPVTRKVEAILLTANDDSDYVTLFDGDCLVTGDITPYLTPEGSGLFSRIKTPEEDGMVFSSHYRKGDTYGSIPKHILEIWRKDVGENDIPRIKNTICSGNITFSKDYIDFARKWHTQMFKVLPDNNTSISHDYKNEPYFQMDESVLDSLVAFAADAPPVIAGNLDIDTSAYVAHLGPYPKPWVFWAKNKLQYYPIVLELIAWAKSNNYKLPEIPWSFKRKNKIPIFILAYLHQMYKISRSSSGKIYRSIRRKIKK
ncbi:MAG: hypothetical protein P9X26_02650 [Candidatus Stygibacter frigidus]|nr:hypothetical protein [Candidatus Stygibacter frigidus]